MSKIDFSLNFTVIKILPTFSFDVFFNSNAAACYLHIFSQFVLRNQRITRARDHLSITPILINASDSIVK